MPGYFPSIASATMLPISDSCSRVGSRRMSLACVPITWLRRTAVCALASSTIAWTSGRPRDAERLGDPGRPSGPRHVAVAHHQLEHGVRRAGVDALGDEDVAAHQVRHAVGVADDHRVDGRVLERVGDVEDRTLPRGPRRVADGVAAQRGALVDDDDLDLDALPRAAARTRPRCGAPRRGTSSPSVAPAATSSGVSSSPAPITPTLTPLTWNTTDGVTQSGASPVSASTMLVARNGKSARACCSSSRATP